VTAVPPIGARSTSRFGRTLHKNPPSLLGNASKPPPPPGLLPPIKSSRGVSPLATITSKNPPSEPVHRSPRAGRPVCEPAILVPGASAIFRGRVAAAQQTAPPTRRTSSCDPMPASHSFPLAAGPFGPGAVPNRPGRAPSTQAGACLPARPVPPGPPGPRPGVPSEIPPGSPCAGAGSVWVPETAPGDHFAVVRPLSPPSPARGLLPWSTTSPLSNRGDRPWASPFPYVVAAARQSQQNRCGPVPRRQRGGPGPGCLQPEGARSKHVKVWPSDFCRWREPFFIPRPAFPSPGSRPRSSISPASS